MAISARNDNASRGTPDDKGSMKSSHPREEDQPLAECEADTLLGSDPISQLSLKPSPASPKKSYMHVVCLESFYRSFILQCCS